MRILHCIPGMGGGGAERQLTYLAHTLREKGSDVHVALTTGGPNLDRLRSSGAQIHTLTGRGNHDPRLFLRLRGLVRNLRPAIVHTWLTQMDILGGVAAWEAGVPWVLSERSSEGAYPRTTKHRAREMLAAKAAAIISNSEGGDRFWDTRVSNAIPRFIIPNGLPLREIDATAPMRRIDHGIDEHNPVVLFAGRFSAEKNAAGFLEAVRSAPMNLVAVLCGEGPLLPDVRGASGVLNGRVRFVGYTPELWRWLKLADVVVCPSYFEGNPNVVMEAMACRSPLVVSDIPAHRSLLDDGSAEFIEPFKPADILRGIVAVLSNPERARKRAQEARKRAESFDIDLTGPKFLAVYNELLSNAAIPKAS